MSGEKVMKAMPVGIEEMLVCFADAVSDVLGKINGVLLKHNDACPEKVAVFDELDENMKKFYAFIGMSVATLPKDLANEDNMKILAEAVIERLEKLGHKAMDVPQDPEEEEYVRPEVDKPDVMYG